MARKSSTAAQAFLAFAQGEESDASIAGRLGVSRQRIQTLHAQYRKQTKQQNPNSENRESNGLIDPPLHGKQFVGPPASALQGASPGNGTPSTLALRTLANGYEQLEVMI